MIERNQYLSKLISAKNNGFPKIITGIRRCGKSYLLKEIFNKHLIETGVSENQIIIIDLDALKNAKYRILTVIQKLFLFENSIEFYENRALMIDANTSLC